MSQQQIALASDGFCAGRERMRWAEVVQVRAFKIDLLTVDEVRFVFVSNSGLAIEISEEQAGFDALLSAAMIYLPSLSGWQRRIVAPAFARNETVLFQR